ncbi:MAG: two-component regulator propeller domain-containing protein, partial [Bacteroidota bacterium]
MTTRTITLFLALFVLTAGAFGQNINFSTLESKDGLSQSSVTHILQDRDGFMWFATQVGIDRYDGWKFEPVENLDKQLINRFTLLQDFDDDHILTGIGKQLYLVHKRNLKAKRIVFSQEQQIDGSILAVFQSQGGYLLFTAKKVYRTQSDIRSLSGPFTLFDKSTSKRVTKVVQTGPDEFIIGTNEGFYSFDATNNKLKMLNRELSVTALFLSKDSLLYIGSDYMYMSAYDLKKKEQLNILNKVSDDPVQHSRAAITSLFIDDENRLWAGTAFAGLYLYKIDLQNPLIIQLSNDLLCRANSTQHQKISSDKITSIAMSKDSVVWVGTHAGGVNYWQKHKQFFQHHFKGLYIGKNLKGVIGKGESDTLISYNNYVLGLWCRNKDQLLVGGEDGLSLVDLQNDFILQRFFPADNSLDAKMVYAVVPDSTDQKSLILGTGNGLYRLMLSDIGLGKRKGTYKKIPTEKLDTAISMIYYNKQLAEWWVSSRGHQHVTVLNENFAFKRRISFSEKVKEEDEKERVSFIQNVAIDTTNYILVATTQAIYFYSSLNPQDTFRLKTNAHVTCAVQTSDRKFLWMGTDRAGLYKFQLDQLALEDKDRHMSDFIDLQKNNLPREVAYAIFKDRFDNLWMSTNHGVQQIDPERKLINLYRQTTGLQGSEFNSGAFCSWRDSVFFIGGVNGVSSFIPAEMIKSDGASPSRLTIKINFPGLDTSSSSYALYNYSDLRGDTTIELPRLPNEFNYLKLNFTLPRYHNPQNNQFWVRFRNKNYYANKGEIIFEQNIFEKSSYGRDNDLIIQYRHGNSDWSKEIHLSIGRRRLTLWSLVLILFFTTIGGGILLALFLRQRTYRKLSDTKDRINTISRLETKEELVWQAMVHLIQDFDYVVFSFVDFNKKRITSEYTKCKSVSIYDPKMWKERSKYDLNEKDILCQIVQLSDSAIVIRNEILNENIDPEGAINEEISQEYDHHKLVRLYVPIIHRAVDSEDLEIPIIEKKNAPSHQAEMIRDQVLGVIEVGLRPKIWQDLRLVKTGVRILAKIPSIGGFLSTLEYLKSREIQLKLYADNFAQPYYRALLKENRRDFYDEIIDPIEDTELDHFEFMEKLLSAIAQKIGVKYGNVSFRTFNTPAFDMRDSENIFYGPDYDQTVVAQSLKNFEDQNAGKTGIIRYVAEFKDTYYTNNAKEDDKYVMVKEEVHSEMSAPMKDKYGIVYGVFSLSSVHKNFFNEVLVNTIKKVVEKATQSFIQKKESNTLTQLMQPFNIFSRNNNRIYKNAVEALQKYFQSDYICVWTRDLGSLDSTRFLLSDASSKAIQEEHRERGYLDNNISDEIQQKNIDIPIQIQQVKDYKNTDARIYKIAKAMEFKSYIVISIIVEKRIEGFINIFSKRKVAKREISQHANEFLENFTKKISVAIQHAQLINAIIKISESLTKRQLYDPLQEIVERAYELMPSTQSIVLFTYHGEEIKMKNSRHAGELPPSDNDPEKRANIANYVIEHDTQWITSAKQHDEIVVKANPNLKDLEKTFWRINKIQSVAAVRLEYDDRTFGVMFFNYTDQKDFNKKDARRIIEAFTNLATTALINEDYIKK